MSVQNDTCAGYRWSTFADEATRSRLNFASEEWPGLGVKFEWSTWPLNFPTPRRDDCNEQPTAPDDT